MILDAVGGFLIGLAGVIVGLLPVAGDLGLDSFGPAIAMFRAFNTGLPVTETLAMATGCLAIIGGIFVTRLLIVVWHVIPKPFSGT